jgi:hypothetical protein
MAIRILERLPPLELKLDAQFNRQRRTAGDE